MKEANMKTRQRRRSSILWESYQNSVNIDELIGPLVNFMICFACLLLIHGLVINTAKVIGFFLLCGILWLLFKLRKVIAYILMGISWLIFRSYLKAYRKIFEIRSIKT